MSDDRFALLVDNQEHSRHRTRKLALAAGDLLAPGLNVHVCDTAPKFRAGRPAVVTWRRKAPLHWSEDRIVTPDT